MSKSWCNILLSKSSIKFIFNESSALGLPIIYPKDDAGDYKVLHFL